MAAAGSTRWPLVLFVGVVVTVIAVCPRFLAPFVFRRPCSDSTETLRTGIAFPWRLRADPTRPGPSGRLVDSAGGFECPICSCSACRLGSRRGSSTRVSLNPDRKRHSRTQSECGSIPTTTAETGDPKGSQGVRRPATLRSTAASLTTRGRNVPVPTLPGGSRTGLTSFLILAP